MTTSTSNHFSNNGATSSESLNNPIPSKKNVLVDIDCNLFHKDFVSLNPTAATTDNTTASDTTTNTNTHSPFTILYHPSTREANIRGVFTPSSTISDSYHAVQALTRYHQTVPDYKSTTSDDYFVDVKTSIGVHPYHTEEEGLPKDNTMSSLSKLIETGLDSKVVACIGECGLDYSPSFPNKEFQIPWFQLQLDLACQYDLPLFIHERLAFKDVITCLDKATTRHNLQKLPSIVIHCFTGTVEECQEYVARDFFIGITGYILKKGDGPIEVASTLSKGIVPLNRLMIETDAPYMGFAGCRDLYWKYEQITLNSMGSKARKRVLQSISPNVPSSLPMVLRGVVNALNTGRQERGEELLTEEQVGRICTQNAIDFFGFTKVL